jgi:hypothetical protein
MRHEAFQERNNGLFMDNKFKDKKNQGNDYMKLNGQIHFKKNQVNQSNSPRVDYPPCSWYVMSLITARKDLSKSNCLISSF